MERVLSQYQAAVDRLLGSSPEPAFLLEALLQRDQVAGLMSAEVRSAERVQQLAALDAQLRQAARNARNADWDAWRKAAEAPAERWWWHLDEAHAKEAEERDFFPRLLAGLLMTITLGLGADISVRLWGSGAGGLSVVSAILTVVFTGGPLTSQGRMLAQWLLERLHFPSRYRGRTMLAAAGLFLMVTLLLRVVALPAWARTYNNRGVTLLQAGDLAGAQRAFGRAVNISPEYAIAYYNLANAYIDIGDYDQAGSLFHQALAADRTFDLAYNGLGYVLTAQGKPTRAIPILYNGLGFAQDDESRVALWSNLGSAYREAGRAVEAESALNQALALDPKEAAAHCTLALVAEDLKRPADLVRLDWENCLSYADPTTARGQELADRARAHLHLLEEVP